MDKIIALNLFLVAGIFGIFAMGYVHQSVEPHQFHIAHATQDGLMKNASFDLSYQGIVQLR